VVWNPCGIGNQWTLKEMKMLNEIFYFYSKPIFLNIFEVGALITNYLHQHYMNLTYEVIMEHNPNPIAHGWARKY
jgi:hypothetical protein